jgi:endonuclease/exonuclease/phosphatase family metal-dependent hydrolase
MMQGMRLLRLFFALIIIAAGCSVRPEANFSPEAPCIKAVTYNVNWGCPRPQNVLDFLNDADADVVCLQETTQQWKEILNAEFGQKYPNCLFKEWRGAGGMMIMSKYTIQRHEVIDPEDGWFPAMLAEIESPFGAVQFLNVHLKPPLSEKGVISVSAYFETKDVHMEELKDILASGDSSRPIVVMGDFNENEKSKATKWLMERGFTDVLSVYDSHSETWGWRIAPGIRVEDRYDHILINSKLECTGARVEKVNASDHMPVLAVIVPKK